MTREEQIRVEAIQYADHESESFVNYPMQESISAFHSGAKWADKHPNWYKYPEDKPERSDEYIVAFDSGNVYTAYYATRFNKWTDPDGAHNLEYSEVIAWMEFPKQPKFDLI